MIAPSFLHSSMSLCDAALGHIINSSITCNNVNLLMLSLFYLQLALSLKISHKTVDVDEYSLYYHRMNDSYLAYQARYLHDSYFYKSVKELKFQHIIFFTQLISIKLLLGLIALPLLWKIRGYKRCFSFTRRRD